VDVERSLIAKSVLDSGLQRAIARGIERRHFFGKAVGNDPAPGEVWDWLSAHSRRYKSSPSVDLFKRRWPTFALYDSGDPFDAVLDEFIRVAKRREMINSIRALSEIPDDPKRVGDAEVFFMEAARELARLVPNSSVNLFSQSLSRRELYMQRVATGQLPGVSFHLEAVDDLTFGVQPHEVAIIEGFLGIGKSTLAIMMAAHAYFVRGETPLFLSLEMDGERLANKWDAYAAGISYQAIKKLELGEGDLAKWEEIGEKAADAKLEKDIIVIDDIHRCTIDRIFAEIERWSPTYTTVDTIDEIRAPSHLKTIYEQQGFAARELKGVTRATKKAIVGIAQAGRDAEEHGATIGNIAGSIDIARKADLVLGLHASEDMQKQKKMEVRMLKTRDNEGRGKKFDYHWDVAALKARPWRPEDALAGRQGVLA
jgi:replicative DNA helicase